MKIAPPCPLPPPPAERPPLLSPAGLAVGIDELCAPPVVFPAAPVIFDPVPLPPVAVAANVHHVYTVAAVVRTKATPKIIAINNLISMAKNH